ncbi:MAG: cation transporter [Anaerolineae bacterium]|nr:cation transporter [Anaerolineae bacterium]
MQSKTFEVPSISCGHCVHTILSELGDLEGVSKAEADETTRLVTVHWDDPATWEQIEDLLIEINYPPAPGTP